MSGSVPLALAVFNNALYCGTSSGLYRFDGAGWTGVGQLAARPLTDIAGSANGLAALTAAGEVFLLDHQESATQVSGPLPFPGTSVAFGSDGVPIVASVGGGVLRSAPPGWIATLPEGPNGNAFVGLAVDPAGALWGGSGTANGTGFFRFDGSRWTAFTRRTGAQPTNDYYRMSVDCDGSVWASSWGAGIAHIPPGADTVASSEIFNTNVGMVGSPPTQASSSPATSCATDRGIGGPPSFGRRTTARSHVRLPDGSWRRSRFVGAPTSRN